MDRDIKPKCVECGLTVAYQGRGRPRQRHITCMTPSQKRDRTYMKSYMPKYYNRPGNRQKHKEACERYITKRRDERSDV